MLILIFSGTAFTKSKKLFVTQNKEKKQFGRKGVTNTPGKPREAAFQRHQWL